MFVFSGHQARAGAVWRGGLAIPLRPRTRTSRRVWLGWVAWWHAGELDRRLAAGPRFSAAVPPDRRELLAARTVLAALARRLRAPDPVTAQGMALLGALLTDGSSPLYRPGEPGALGSRLRAAAAALEPAEPRDWQSAAVAHKEVRA